ncbi:MAG: 2-C-methyl-D-erythritol 4-phosphate cytidylyltransferase [Candidatus Cloacimonetes bacterium]|nr:2-C-methyl-D-erythritol 4-phosphate cytidylyltransferase [Candidatus Cloacimonadota bacterium]
MKNVAIITAGGVGKRYPGKDKKQYLDINGKPVLIWSVENFYFHPDIESIYVTAPTDSLNYTKSLLDMHFPDKSIVVVKGGEVRQESVYNALSLVPSNTDYVLIHDGVRPLITLEEITKLLDLVREHKAVIPGHKIRNTIKEVKGNKVINTLPRTLLYEIFTPQVFAYQLIADCHKKAVEDKVVFTDDAAILEYFGYPVYVAETSAYNIKITEPADYEFVKLLISKRL